MTSFEEVRNNTSFSVEVEEYFKSVFSNEVNEVNKVNNYLQLSQQAVCKYWEKYHPKGMILYHEMGTGKTITSIALMIDLYERREINGVVLLMGKTLQDNFIKNIKKYCSATGRRMPPHDFVTINANNMPQKLMELTTDPLLETSSGFANLNKKLVLVDEAHNLVNSIVSGSKNATYLYNSIMKSPACRVLLMTASVAINDPFEVAIAANMVSGKKLFGEDYENFHRYFIQGSEVVNADKLANRLSGLISYYSIGDSDENFAKVLERQVVIVPMSEGQFTFYAAARDKERAQNLYSSARKKQASKGMSKGVASGSYRVMSRQYSNCMKYNDTSEITKENIAEYSPKTLELLKRLAHHLPVGLEEFCEISKRKEVGPGFIYTPYKKYGTDLIKRALELWGAEDISDLSLSEDKSSDKSNNKSSPSKLKFCILSGETEEREGTINIVNSGAAQLLIFTATGAEGISPMGMRHGHRFGSEWNEAKGDQIEGRGRRYHAHDHLPVEERTFRTYIYLSDYPTTVPDDVRDREVTTDIHMFNVAKVKGETIGTVLDILKAVAIDCSLHKLGYNCHLCTPTGKRLFMDDLRADLESPNPCTPYTTEKVLAQEIIVGDQKYYYTIDGPTNEINIYIFSPAVNSYIPLDSNLEVYLDVYKAIKKLH